MAKFLNNPSKTTIAGRKFVLTWEPALYQWAGTPVKDEIVEQFLHAWAPKTWETDLETFRKRLNPDQHVWVVPPYKVSDGSSQPWFVDWLLPRAFMFLPSLFHDDIRPKATTGHNMTSDGFFRDMILVSARQNKFKKMGKIRATAAFLGVRLGSKMKMNFAPHPFIISESKTMLERKYGPVLGQQFHYEEQFCEFMIP